MLHSAVGMTRESAFGAREYGFVGRPGPTAEAGPLVIAKGLLNFVAGVHDKRPILRDGFSDRPSLQQQELAFARAILDEHLIRILKLNCDMAIDKLVIDLNRIASEEIQCAVCALPRRRQVPLRFWRNFDRPYLHVGIG